MVDQYNNPEDLQNAFNSTGGAGFDVGGALNQLKTMLGGSQSYGAPNNGQAATGPGGQAGFQSGPSFVSNSPTQFLGAWNNPNNPYWDTNRGAGTAQTISGNGQLYDWQAPTAQQFQQFSPVLQQGGYSADAFKQLGWNGQDVYGPGQQGAGQFGNVGNAAIPPDMLQMFASMLGGGNQRDPNNFFQNMGNGTVMRSTPGTYSLPGAQGISGMGGQQVSGANPFAGGPVPGGNAIDFLDQLSGGAVPDFLQTLGRGEAVTGPGNLNDALMGLGQFPGVPSPQSIGNLSPSENEFMQGFFESVLGIPWEDIMGASYQPFEGLSSSRKPRRRYGQ